MKKGAKPKVARDRFDEVLNAVRSVDIKLSKKIDNVDRKTGVQYDDLKHHIGLVAEQVAGNSEQIGEIKEEISKLTEMVDMLRMDLKLKADNLELITLSRRVAVLEKRMASKR